MWLILFGVMAVLACFAVVYLTRGFHRFRVLERLGEKHRLLSWLLTLLPVAGILCWYFFNAYTMLVVLVYMLIIWVLCDLTAAVIRKIRKKERTRNYAGGAALLISAALFGSGWFFAHHVFATHYSFRTEKALFGKPLRIAMLADSHLSVTLNGSDFAEQIRRIRAENPDLLLICGDFVDDETTKADMLEACAALGTTVTDFRTFFCYGNHDKGYYSYRNFTVDELERALKDNGVRVLQDEVVPFGDEIALIGRCDRSAEDRVPIADLAAGQEGACYQIVMDHQPDDYAAEAAAGVDLVLSGHTHGGHMFPAGQFGLLIGANDRIYGTERRGQTDFLVTSGISGWAIPFKIGCISEYCIIDIVPDAAG